MHDTESHYRFAAVADIHIDLEDGGRKTYFTRAQENFARALQVIWQHGCDFIISVGDQVTNASGATEEWERYRRIIEDSGYTGRIFAAMGNHETRSVKYGRCTLDEARGEFIIYAGLDRLPIQRPAEKTYYLYEDGRFGDVYLFLSLENGVDTNRIDNFSDEQMSWAEKTAERCTRENRRVFLIQHAPFYGFGAGDDAFDPAYEGSIRIQGQDGRPYSGNQRFFDLIRRYKNIIWLSGHTHVDLRDRVNYSSDHSEACHMLHIPALAGTTRLTYDRNGARILDRTFRPNTAQGYLVDVYRDKVVFQGIEFSENRLYPDIVYTIRS